MASLKLTCLLLACIAMVAATPIAGAITCGEVTNSVIPCLGYLRGSGGAIPTRCCYGIMSLNSAAKSTLERQTACKCLKAAAGRISGLNLKLAARLPGKCGVNIPFQISPSTNCDRY